MAFFVTIKALPVPPPPTHRPTGFASVANPRRPYPHVLPGNPSVSNPRVCGRPGVAKVFVVQLSVPRSVDIMNPNPGIWSSPSSLPKSLPYPAPTSLAPCSRRLNHLSPRGKRSRPSSSRRVSTPTASKAASPLAP